MSGTAANDTATKPAGFVPSKDQIVGAARNMNDLVQQAEQFQPQLAAQLRTKAAIYSKTNWFVPLSMIISWAATHYGFQLDADAQSAIVVGVGTVVTWIMRQFTHGSVAGIATVPDSEK